MAYKKNEYDELFSLLNVFLVLCMHYIIILSSSSISKHRIHLDEGHDIPNWIQNLLQTIYLCKWAKHNKTMLRIIERNYNFGTPILERDSSKYLKSCYHMHSESGYKKRNQNFRIVLESIETYT